MQQDVKVPGLFKPDRKREIRKICSELPAEDLVGQLQGRMPSLTMELVLIAVLLAFLCLYCVCFAAGEAAKPGPQWPRWEREEERGEAEAETTQDTLRNRDTKDNIITNYYDYHYSFPH